MEQSQLVTNGISPKAVLAFVFPVVAAILASAASWVVSGDFNQAEIRTAVGGVITALIGAIGAYVGAPGAVTSR